MRYRVRPRSTTSIRIAIAAFDPFKKIGFEPDKLGVHGADSLVPTVAVAVGLALRKAGDR